MILPRAMKAEELERYDGLELSAPYSGFASLTVT